LSFGALCLTCFVRFIRPACFAFAMEIFAPPPLPSGAHLPADIASVLAKIKNAIGTAPVNSALLFLSGIAISDAQIALLHLIKGIPENLRVPVFLFILYYSSEGQTFFRHVNRHCSKQLDIFNYRRVFNERMRGFSGKKLRVSDIVLPDELAEFGRTLRRTKDSSAKRTSLFEYAEKVARFFESGDNVSVMQEFAKSDALRVEQGRSSRNVIVHLSPIKTVPLELIHVSAGSFLMGSRTHSHEERAHTVHITKPFWLGKTPVTQLQYAAGTPLCRFSRFKGVNRPVERVAWTRASEFCEKFTERCYADGTLSKEFEFSLPTEAQWEYACRAGTTGDYGGTGGLDALGWYVGNSGGETHDVATKRANEWGFFDMHGNVWEWCADWYDDYPARDVFDPAGPSSGQSSGNKRVRRGGSWESSATNCRAANRAMSSPSSRRYNSGFRVALRST